jgi:hypothetical protein
LSPEVPDDLIKERRKTTHLCTESNHRSNGFERRFEEILQIEAWTKPRVKRKTSKKLSKA